MYSKIDYELLGKAMSAYKELGYEYIEANWMLEDPNYQTGIALSQIDKIVSDKTRYLVGSAEQSLATLFLPPGNYMACTPCFRWPDEGKSRYHQRYFMKIELFSLADRNFREILEDAKGVMGELTTQEIYSKPLEDGTIDLEIGGVEIGSYGAKFSYNYGTGLALPRFSLATTS